ncbi:hypothetical protein EAG_04311 [Camponotus floridanus]|uniref:Uncharacterized protein n=1 Tax=Camponotus floridanus TaxID=104421 RepID=E2AHT9_CAMFO|nr:hypothetical protein EAG_04311 [Camponotus floridanus]
MERRMKGDAGGKGGERAVEGEERGGGDSRGEKENEKESWVPRRSKLTEKRWKGRSSPERYSPDRRRNGE